MEQDHMQREQPPSYTQSHSQTQSVPHNHDLNCLDLPSVPTTDPSPAHIHHERTLPPLPPTPAEPRYRSEEHPFVWPSSNPLTAYYQPGPSQLSPKTKSPRSMDSPTMMDIDTPESRGRRGGSVVSIDDPDVRLAAEALGDLRADFIGSPPQHPRSMSSTSPRSYQSRGSQQQQPEPLLSLLTTSHPLLGTAIGGSLSAYSASKNYSPRFKSGAEYVERRFTPVVNTVGTVGRFTGVEGGVRWFLGGRRPSHSGPSESENDRETSNKRRKYGGEDTDMDRSVPHDPYGVHRQELHHRTRRPSQASTTESLPAYDDHRSPSYEATQNALITTQDESASPGNGTWQSRLVLSTSGLSVAMSEESLCSLKYCLSWLRWANEHIGKVVTALKNVLEQYERDALENCHRIEGSDAQKQLVVRSEADKSELNAKIAELKKDVLKTLKDVVDIVSKYAGGALPENARLLVRRHLTSLPQRFRLASTRNSEGAKMGGNGDSEVSDGANRVLVLAKEGLDMMSQVSGVLDGTIVSAEEWCERLGRSKREDRERNERQEEGLEKPPMELPPMDPGDGGFTSGYSRFPNVKMS